MSSNDLFMKYLLDESDRTLVGFTTGLDGFDFPSDAFLHQPTVTSSKDVSEEDPNSLQGQIKSTELATKASTCSIDKKKTKSNTWRQRQRLEVLRLREEVKQLDEELKGMKMAIGVRSTIPLTAVGTRQSTICSAVRKLTGESWQDAATRVSSARQISKVENKRLRKILLMQTQHARKLQRLLKHCLTNAAVEKTIGFRHTMAFESRFGPPRDNREVFQRLLAQFDEHQGDIAAICLEKEPRVWINSTRGLQVQLMDQCHVPFSVEDTEQALWKRQSQQGFDAKEDKIIYDELFDSDSCTTLQSVRVFVTNGSLNLSLLIRKACRKYTESGRTYFVLHETSTVVADSGDAISYDETMWRVVKPGERYCAALPSAIIETHVLATFPSYKAVTCLPSSSLTAWHNSIMRFNNTVEDMLVEGGRRPKQ